MHTRSRNGFALVVSLIVLVVVVSLGVGAAFLSTMNLRVAENTRTHAVAVANANSGLELAMIRLYQAFESATPKQFPATFGDADIPDYPDPDVQFLVDSYTLYSPTLVRVAIRGVGPRNSEFVSEALLGSTIFQVDPTFALGMVSERSVGVAGASGTFIDAGLHTNDALWLPGWSDAQFTYCTEERLPNGRCPSGALSTYDLGNEPLTVWEGGSQTCGPGQGPAPFCSGGRVNSDYLVSEEIIVNPDYHLRRYRAAGGTTDEDGEPDSPGSDGAIQIDGTILYGSDECASEQFMCRSGDQTVTPGMLVNKTLITDGNVTVDCDESCTLNNATIISTEGQVDLGSVTGASNTRIFSESSITNATGTWNGQSTLASAGDVTFTGTAQMFPGFGGPTVGMAVIAEGNITVDGGGGTEMVGVYVAGEQFVWNGGGGVYIFGSVLVKEEISIAGGYTIDAGADVSNVDLDGIRGQAEVISRR